VPLHDYFKADSGTKNALDKVTEGNFDVTLPKSKIDEVVGLTSSAEIFIQGFKATKKK
jgi:hypothetical protein